MFLVAKNRMGILSFAGIILSRPSSFHSMDH
jgi:hypothetical protein